MRCPECGANLEAHAGARFVRCRYCGARFRLGPSPAPGAPRSLRRLTPIFILVVILIVAAPVVVVSLTIVLFVVVPQVRAPAVTYKSVVARPEQTPFGTALTVEIELETKTSMPHVPPHVDVSARCEGHSDSAQAFFMSLSNLGSGARVVDTAELFEMGELKVAPKSCEITLQLTGGGKPEKFCYRDDKTVPGGCP